MSARPGGFEGSYLGDGDRIDPAAKLECGVCWWVYDPDRGDEVWQIEAGTPFRDLPDHWRCPNCDTPREQFMVIDGEVAESVQRPEPDAGVTRLEQRIGDVQAAYEAVDERMRSLPVHNDALQVETVGFRRWTEGLLGIVITPWCMNIVLVPDGSRPRAIEGSKRDVDLPSGQYEFIAGHLDGVGAIEACSLFSPMESFESMEVARAVAEHAMTGLFEAREPPAEPEAEAVTERPVSRRGFLKGAGLGSR